MVYIECNPHVILSFSKLISTAEIGNGLLDSNRHCLFALTQPYPGIEEFLVRFVLYAIHVSRALSEFAARYQTRLDYVDTGSSLRISYVLNTVCDA